MFFTGIDWSEQAVEFHLFLIFAAVLVVRVF